MRSVDNENLVLHYPAHASFYMLVKNEACERKSIQGLKRRIQLVMQRQFQNQPTFLNCLNCLLQVV